MNNSEGETARISKTPAGFLYRPTRGDPLDLGFDGATELTDQQWWAHTRNHHYPDPLHRIWQGFHDLVKNPAEIIISMKDGYVVGPKFLALPLALKGGCGGTHGGLQATQSNGFFTTDFMAPPANMRAEWVHENLKRAVTGHPLSVPFTSQRPLVNFRQSESWQTAPESSATIHN